MKRIVCMLTGLFALGAMRVLAQPSGQNTPLDQLEAPSMPAATMVGAQVNDITRPGNVKDIKAALLNNFLDSSNSFIFPNNYGIEVNPYQISGMKNFNYHDYLEDDLKQNLWRTFSVSVATNNSFLVNDSIATNALGVGARITLLRGKVSLGLADAVKTARAKNLGILDIKSAFSSYFQSGYRADPSLKNSYTKSNLQSWMIDAVNQYYTGDKALFVQYIHEAFAKIPDNTSLDGMNEAFVAAIDEMIADAQLNSLQNLMKQVNTDRGGIKWDINYAQALNFPEQSWSDLNTSQWGLWTNFSITPMVTKHNIRQASDFEFIVLARYIRVNESFFDQFNPTAITFDPGNNLDFGTRLVLDKEKFSLEAEYIARINDANNTDKWVVNANYKITKNIVISYNIGKNYDRPGLTGNDLISGLTVNFGFGGYKLSDLLKPDTYINALTE